MADGTCLHHDGSGDTQLEAIRDLMLTAARRGVWLTLGEIAQVTAIGEASVSAQLRHLRKRRHGLHLVEKRRRSGRRLSEEAASGERHAGKMRGGAESAMWEYRVMPATRWGSAAVACEDTPTASAQRRCNPPDETEANAGVAGGIERTSDEVNDAEARN
jgi:hypothetical protein